ncbi:GNAT family N-acetyltransferase [Hymenobacter busanensis]|uniref:GNAT family N-acetyltransferase n=1 Tax=Hymenobacter busanensis TaxID=2607656 RepID=A0A7L4ZWH2_9BACT|nr:GNAT family N-acetyltransferase [Hymenobacter busanensis]KAA9327105.1 GNAT family N-acetyltransferase [Hymenobacter busanensis]QHJ05770.1 GNAT family N-acetyltransferase [Hymenobacter busanensis]
MLATVPVFRAYEAIRDEEAVLQLFRSNLAPYFVPEEEADLLAFLRGEVSTDGLPYFVAELAGHAGLVAAGGYALNHPYAVLTWGMVNRQLHGQGLGRAFTAFRIAQCRQAYPGKSIEIKTSQHTEGFYAKLGFRTLAIEPDKWAPGLHEVHMLLEV